MRIEFIPLSGRRWGQHHPRGIVALGTVDLGLEVAEPEVGNIERAEARVRARVEGEIHVIVIRH